MSSVFPVMTELAEGMIEVKRPQTRCGKIKREKAMKVKWENIMRN